MYDVAVVGAGPAGVSAALNLGRACRGVALLDTGEGRNATAQGVQGLAVGSGLPPERYREAAESVVDCLPEMHRWKQRVSSVSGEAEKFQLLLADDSVIHARRVLLATGTVRRIARHSRSCPAVGPHSAALPLLRRI